MLTLTERPEAWSYSRNHIRYRLQAAQLGGMAIEVQVRLYVGDVAGNAYNDKLVTLYSLTPAADGSVEVYVEDLVDAHLQWQLPAPASGTITPVSTQTASFFVEHREITLLNPNPAWVSDVAARCRAIKAGLPVDLFNRSLPTQFSVLSYQVAHVARVGISDHFYKTFVSFATQQTTGRNAIIEVLYADNSTQTATIVFPSLGFNIYHVPASPAAWGLALAAGKVPASYRVSIEETIAGAVATTVLIDAVFDHNWYRQVYALQYHNSLGGMDHMRLVGDFDIETERSYTEGETILGANWNEAQRRGQYQQRNLAVQKTFKGDAGYFMNPAEQDVAQELDLTESVWELRPLSPASKQWVQQRITNKPRKLRSRSSKRWSYEVEWQPAFAITAFSSLPYPGPGADTNTYVGPVCGLVSGLVATILYSNGAPFVQFTWSAGINAAWYNLHFREVGTTVWPFTVVTYSTDYVFTLDTGKTYEWEVRSRCSTSDSSAWLAGPNFTL